jgi:hypothetical protein|uniref:Uncharacterized protein n=1 Tax=Haptolina ericina TaxID=156174 RepID=A0A7S3EV51_9EUKA
MALGGAGGCIPVFVIPEIRRGPGSASKSIGAMLPYTRWLDYCSTAYVVSDTTARVGFSAVLTKLRAVGEAEAAAKLDALRGVRDAFVFRSGGRPSAQQQLLAEACAMGRRYRQGVASAPEPVGGAHARCTLG